MHTVKCLEKESMYLNERKYDIKYNIVTTN